MTYSDHINLNSIAIVGFDIFRIMVLNIGRFVKILLVFGH